MGDKRVNLLLKKYKNMKIIAALKPNEIHEALGITTKLSKKIILTAKDQI